MDVLHIYEVILSTTHIPYPTKLCPFTHVTKHKYQYSDVVDKGRGI